MENQPQTPFCSPFADNPKYILPKIAGFIEFTCSMSYSNDTFMCLCNVLHIPSSIKMETTPNMLEIKTRAGEHQHRSEKIALGKRNDVQR